MDSLVADYGTSSGSDASDDEGSSDSSTTETIKTVKKNPVESQTKKPALPPPSFDDNSASIFTNPYIEAENAKSAILEKHVKMIPSKEFITEINGKKICWMYRKGRCRFGSNCKYAHDSELYNQETPKSEETPDTDQTEPPPPKASEFVPHQTSGFPPHQTSGFPPHQISGFPPHQPTSEDLQQSSSSDADSRPSEKRKKRPGLSQSIVPGKKKLSTAIQRGNAVSMLGSLPQNGGLE